jgi:hypothetical protein
MVTLAHDPRLDCFSPTCSRTPKRVRNSAALAEVRGEPLPPDDPPPVEPPAEPEEPGGPDETEIPCTDDADWDVFIRDDDCDPLPEPGDFWIEDPEGE